MHTAPENTAQNWQDQTAYKYAEYRIAEDPSNTGTGVCAR